MINRDLLNKKRKIAFVYDFICYSYIMSLLLLTWDAFVGIKIFPPHFQKILIIVMSIFIIKDVIAGRSLGKKLWGLRVVSPTEKRVNIFRLVLRNITIPMWIIEIVVFEINGYRLGDKLAGTMVISEDDELNTSKKIIYTMIVFLIPLVFFFGLIAIYGYDSIISNVKEFLTQTN